MSKGWFVTVVGMEEQGWPAGEYVLAETRTEAKKIMSGEGDWFDIRAKRVPAIDGAPRITDRLLMDANVMYLWCNGCTGKAFHENGGDEHPPVYGPRDEVYCSVACRDRPKT